MAKRKKAPKFNTLWEAVSDGNRDDVRDVIDRAGGVPEEREEEGESTPLMLAAGLGRRDIVQTLLDAGADANIIATDEIGLPKLPFLEPLHESGNFPGMTALAYAAGYGHHEVFDLLASHTSQPLLRLAEQVRAAREKHLRSLDAKGQKAFLQKQKRPISGVAAARKALLAENPKARRWVVQCALCHRQGYKPTMPEEIDRQGTAPQIRRLFRAIEWKEGICQRCRDKVEKAGKAAEALFQKRMSEFTAKRNHPSKTKP